MRILELPDKLNDAGLYVVETADWQTRGYEFPTRPRSALRHWTVGAMGIFPSQGVLINGRKASGSQPALPGPLIQVGQDRRGGPGGIDRVHIIASGKANHAGAGHWPKGSDIDSNYEVLGLEIEWQGPNEAFDGRRKEVSEQIMAVLIDCCDGKNPDHACEHREWAEPDGRKIDTNLDGRILRARVRAILNSQGDDDMPLTDSDVAKVATAVRTDLINVLRAEEFNVALIREIVTDLLSKIDAALAAGGGSDAAVAAIADLRSDLSTAFQP